MTATYDPVSGTRAAPPAIGVLSWLTAGCFVLGCVLPLTSTGGNGPATSLADGGTAVVVLIVVLVACLVAGGFGSGRSPLAVGVAGGASAVASGLSIMVATLIIKLVDGLSEFGTGISVGPGCYFLIGTAIVGLPLLFGVWTAAGRRGGRTAPGLAFLGFVAAMAPMAAAIPPPDLHVPFEQWNLLSPDGAIGATVLIWLGLSAVAGMVGFASGTRRGVGLALGSFLPWAWLTIATLTEVGESSGSDVGVSAVLRTEVHPLLPIALGVEAVLLLVAIAATAASPAASVATRRPPPPPPPPPSRPAAPRPPVARPVVSAPPTTAWAPPAAPAPVPSAAAAAHPPTALPRPPWSGAVPTPDATARRGADPGALRLTFDDGTSWVVDRTTYLGRDPTSPDAEAEHVAVVDPSLTVSKTHARLRRDGAHWWLDDLGSVNGTEVNSVAVASDGAGGSCRLLPPAAIQLGDRSVLIEHA